MDPDRMFIKDKISIKPKTMAELLPDLRGFISKDALQTYTDRKQPRPTAVDNRSLTAEKHVKPMSIAELTATLSACKVNKNTPRRAQEPAANKKKWNSSIKVEKKTTSHSATSNGLKKHNSVRKILNFQQPRPPKTVAPRNTIINTETLKFPKAEGKVKKSLLPAPANNTVRISGVYPLSTNKHLKSRMTQANKENLPSQPVIQKLTATPKSLRKMVFSKIPDTPLSNASWKNSTETDTSFLQHEKDIENKNFVKKEVKDKTPEKLTELSASMSTPFRQYRDLNEFFSNSMNNSEAFQDDTIMSFDPPNKREESVIVSLCDMLQKTNVKNTEKLSTELDDLLEVKRKIESNIEMMDSNIKVLNFIKENEQKTLKYVCEEIQKKSARVMPESQTKSQPGISHNNNCKDFTPPMRKSCSTIKSCLKSQTKSPSYKIPSVKMSSVKKKVWYTKNTVRIMSPVTHMREKAYDMYMSMKGDMNFLTTPAKQIAPGEPSTPAITSLNLQKQLDRLCES